ncbi:ZIP family metal transporter [Vibrio sp.]|uniref:ZIP family metal transporter n=1 Tax=Vibrio viridaestus TaxID=2487322 RepID=A0A3N9TJF0_9VIBR|nr:ZIP family metal transporter [Vibrio viridaestus]MDC0610364.1 ZIP family metal transporter [Vibrio sp.]RQW64310.1 ZIP family metal transporter [Vibrio viridaestus]
MENTQQLTWLQTARHHSSKHPYISWGLFGSFILIVLLVVLALTGEHQLYSRYALLGGGAGFAATAIGTLPALFLKNIPQRLSDLMLGFAAGMMLAASAFSLLLPGIDAAINYTNSNFIGGMIVVFGMALGVALMLGLDQFTPHEHKAGPCGPGHERCGRAWLFVFAIALHNFPEGMAIGVGYAQGDLSVGLPLTTAIALQDIPEGLAVALTLRAAGFKPLFSVLLAIATGLLEPMGSMLGVSLAGGYMLAYPIGLGLAGGAMLFVVSHEVIPETHRSGHETLATLGLMIGFALMMILDTTLG